MHLLLSWSFPYHIPTLKGLSIRTWHRLQGFVVRAGKAIVTVYLILGLLSAIGTDGSFGQPNRQDSVISAVGKAITPAFHPMGIEEENWPATVGLFTGLFAKEVVVGTLNALYSDVDMGSQPLQHWEALGPQLLAAWHTIPVNLGQLLQRAGIHLDYRLEISTTLMKPPVAWGSMKGLSLQ